MIEVYKENVIEVKKETNYLDLVYHQILIEEIKDHEDY